ncbi:MAG: DUF6514 family protein [Oscillospiraceae bacterium]|nr:DUF6514 family protein [Oscillospiraceae bacterium]
MRKSFKYQITSREVAGVNGGTRRVYGVKITTEYLSRRTDTEIPGVTDCLRCAAQLRDTLERHRVTPAHAYDVVRDLLYLPPVSQFAEE